MNLAMNADKIVTKAIEEEKDSLRSLSENIWSNPELNYEEVFAHKILTDYLEDRVDGGIMRQHLLWDSLSFTCLIKLKETYLNYCSFAQRRCPLITSKNF